MSPKRAPTEQQLCDAAIEMPLRAQAAGKGYPNKNKATRKVAMSKGTKGKAVKAKGMGKGAAVKQVEAAGVPKARRDIAKAGHGGSQTAAQAASASASSSSSVTAAASAAASAEGASVAASAGAEQAPGTAQELLTGLMTIELSFRNGELQNMICYKHLPPRNSAAWDRMMANIEKLMREDGITLEQGLEMASRNRWRGVEEP